MKKDDKVRIDIDFDSAVELLHMKINNMQLTDMDYSDAKRYCTIPSWLRKMEEQYKEMGIWLQVCCAFHKINEE